MSTIIVVVQIPWWAPYVFTGVELKLSKVDMWALGWVDFPIQGLPTFVDETSSGVPLVENSLTLKLIRA